ncbi:MAG: hypothetical protein ABIE92_10435 [bacterium]
MQFRSLPQYAANLAVLLVMAIFMAGCYTMFQHPQLTHEERAVAEEAETTGYSCTLCHNNDYDHSRMYPHNSWGFGSWGIRSYPYGYSSYGYSGYGGYYGWQRYYYDPWWYGYSYNPYPYYYPPGGGGSGGTGSGMSATPERPETRRGWNGSPNNAPPPPPPVYTGGSTSGGGGSSGDGSSSGGSSGDSNSDDNGRDGGRRGSGR